MCKYWFLWDYWEEIKMLACELNVRFRHILKEANMVADFLAKQGTRGTVIDFSGLDSIQGYIRVSLMDKLGISYVRT